MFLLLCQTHHMSQCLSLHVAVCKSLFQRLHVRLRRKLLVRNVGTVVLLELNHIAGPVRDEYGDGCTVSSDSGVDPEFRFPLNFFLRQGLGHFGHLALVDETSLVATDTESLLCLGLQTLFSEVKRHEKLAVIPSCSDSNQFVVENGDIWWGTIATFGGRWNIVHNERSVPPVHASRSSDAGFN